MASHIDLTVIVASYLSSEEAASDLSALDDSYWRAVVETYDAVIVVTDAWNQVRVASRTGRDAGGIFLGSLHDALTDLFGGPFVGGKAPRLPADKRLTEVALLGLADVLPAGSVRAVVVTQIRKADEFAQMFPHADWIATQEVEWMEEDPPDLAPIVAQVMRQGAQASKRKGRPA
jgi:hypothetical protein